MWRAVSRRRPVGGGLLAIAATLVVLLVVLPSAAAAGSGPSMAPRIHVGTVTPTVVAPLHSLATLPTRDAAPGGPSPIASATCPGPSDEPSACPTALGPAPAASDGNSTPVPEVGAVVASATLSGTPAQIVFASHSEQIYVLDSKSSNVTVLYGTAILGVVQVGSSPSGLVYNPSNGYVYVSNKADRTVSVLNGTSVLTTLTVGSSPLGGLYDPADGYVYIPNSGSNNVSVINDTRVVASLPVGLTPGTPIYDPAHQYVYVPDTTGGTLSIVANGRNVDNVTTMYGDPVSLVFDPVDSQVYFTTSYYGYSYLMSYNGTAFTQNYGWVTGTSANMACDARTGYLYITDPSYNQIQIVSQFTVVATPTIGAGPRDVSFDPATGRIYVANTGGNNISVLSGLSVVGSVKVGAGPVAVAPVPGESLIMASVGGAHSVSLISTSLAIGPSALSPPGDPAASLDLGQSVIVNASLWGLGSGTLSASAAVVPDTGLGCAGSPVIVSDVYSDHLELACTPTATGSFAVTLNVTDSAPHSVWSRLTVTVFAAPSADVPSAAAGGRPGVRAADVGQPVTFSVNATSGTRVYSYNWSVPSSSCNATHVAQPRCTFVQSGAVDIAVAVTDSNGAVALSPSLAFTIDPALAAAIPTAPFGSADVGQNLTFAEAPTGGSGSYSGFVWTGLPVGGCTALATATPRCTFIAAMDLSIGVSFEDSNGASATSPTLSFHIYPRPVMGTLDATRGSLDIGQSVYFHAPAAGGLGPLRYGWVNLPTGCSGTTTAAPVCAPTAPGSFDVRAVALDSNGGSSLPSNDVWVFVFTDPFAPPPTLSASQVPVGTVVHLNVTIRGGAGENVVNWTGLPDHCSVQGVHVDCVPTQPGTYPIAVDVTDRNGFLATSNVSILTVTPAATDGSGASSGLSLGDPTMAYVVIGVFAGVVVAVVLVGLKLRAPRPPPEPAEAPAPDLDDSPS